MEQLKRTFYPNSVLKASHLNEVVDKVNELAEASLTLGDQAGQAYDGAKGANISAQLQAVQSMQTRVLTQGEYDNIIRKEMRWYAVMDNLRLSRIYFGPTLIAERGTNESTAFNYDFPIIF